ncbi:hypothetical protein Glo7428_3756 [Gloeocapsa sp. PCC 7428]|uniref:hypothetical protein n=1 Tax=Gloeocapsa sp. PCC 7428 TaxID=1173026 RepID=UPI0002A601DE|nr:hypothetical protein [Gloeocapsa sp. PCC 7428]AFZ32216.1 hypothetical protein Glo7428_3756 [Gloeocapsa sp. PCC 7428]
MPSIEFYLQLPLNPRLSLIYGYLLIKRRPQDAGIKMLATSGTVGHQCAGSWTRKRRGPLPPSGAIGAHKYTVSTQRLWLPHVKGVEGSFYAIAPFSVQLGSVTRGDFGIHFDANVPGSAGCIVIPQQAHWDLFCQLMQEFRDAGIQQIPLAVYYST